MLSTAKKREPFCTDKSDLHAGEQNRLRPTLSFWFPPITVNQITAKSNSSLRFVYVSSCQILLFTAESHATNVAKQSRWAPFLWWKCRGEKKHTGGFICPAGRGSIALDVAWGYATNHERLPNMAFYCWRIVLYWSSKSTFKRSSAIVFKHKLTTTIPFWQH